MDLVEEIEREFIPVVFHDYFPVKNVTMEIELYLVPSELTSLESVMSVKHVSSIEGNRFIDLVDIDVCINVFIMFTDGIV